MPESPPLVKYRVEDAFPFTVTGVDFTGALYVRDQRGRENKAYVCLFTCAATRAVHLELMSDLTVDTFMHAFRRFCSRKSLPTLMVSDNASTYTAAANHLHSLFKSPRLQEELANRGTQWSFIPKRAPWYGGWWERFIGLTKTTLKKVLGRSFVSFETLRTIVTEIEATMNDRPLTNIHSEYDSKEVLTPAHLLFGRTVRTLPYIYVSQTVLENDTSSNHEALVKRERVQKKLLDHFRARWGDEYLTSLREFHRARGHKPQMIQVGDVVQIHDILPRSGWKMAIVESRGTMD